MSSKAALRRKRTHAKDRRLAPEVPAALCRGFPQTLVRVMQESLMGNPLTIFVPDGSNENTGARGFRYFKAASMNADWWQHAILAKKEGGVGLDGPELQWAMQRVQTCDPLIDSRREHRWLRAFIQDARKNGWCAAWDGKESPLCVSPEPPMKRAKLGPGSRRVWLALAEPDYARLLLDARLLHESPNLFVHGILKDRWYDVDERAGMQAEEHSGMPARPTRAALDDIPF